MNGCPKLGSVQRSLNVVLWVEPAAELPGNLRLKDSCISTNWRLNFAKLYAAHILEPTGAAIEERPTKSSSAD
jgi:hypothetical protein